MSRLPNGHGPQPGPPRRTQRVQSPAPLPAAHSQQASQIAPLPVLEQQYNALVEQNKAGFAELQLKGAEIHPLSVLHARIDKLIESIARFAGPDGPQWAMLTRLEFEQAVAENIAAAQGQATKAQLAMGGQASPGDIARMAREAGTFGKRGSW